jgi:hypothetical protein
MTDELPLTVGSKGQPLWTFEEVRKDYNGNPAAWEVRDFERGLLDMPQGCAATNESDAAFTPPTDNSRPRSSDTEKVAA